MSKHLTSEELALYVDAIRLERETELPRKIRTHVSGCEPCKRAVLDLLELTQELPYTHGERHPWFDRESAPLRTAWGTVWRVAAALAAAIGLGTVWYLLDPPGDRLAEPLTEFVAEDSTRGIQPEGPAEGLPRDTAKPAPELAARFEESANLEDLVGMPLRTGAVTVASPPAGALLDGTIELTWETLEPGPYAVSILDNRDRVVFDTALSVRGFVMRERLEPGLYYWRVVAGGRLQLVSKFFVREPAPKEEDGL